MNLSETWANVRSEEHPHTGVFFEQDGLRMEWKQNDNPTDSTILAEGYQYKFHPGDFYLSMFFRIDRVQKDVFVDTELMLEVFETLQGLVDFSARSSEVSDNTIVTGYTNARMYLFCKRFGFKINEKDLLRVSKGNPMERVMMYSNIGEIRSALESEKVQNDLNKLRRRARGNTKV